MAGREKNGPHHFRIFAALYYGSTTWWGLIGIALPFAPGGGRGGVTCIYATEETGLLGRVKASFCLNILVLVWRGSVTGGSNRGLSRKDIFWP